MQQKLEKSEKKVTGSAERRKGVESPSAYTSERVLNLTGFLFFFFLIRHSNVPCGSALLTRTRLTRQLKREGFLHVIQSILI